ncbi:hypothetical protein HPP92_017387 [Vanilla planifolia]|uniref:Uncharacterized protein n=1 Tax=Vanilla planifolia TaxID=51239 RepID=A0A835QEC7_VANPL|nr:hypothetical protein HPP92_017387 [Vanilla planifolia]
MASYTLHMALAALAGASVAAVSSYLMHRKALSTLLEIALMIERGRGAGEKSTSKDGVSSPSKPFKSRQRMGTLRQGRRRRRLERRRSPVMLGENADRSLIDRFFSGIECEMRDGCESEQDMLHFDLD